MRKEMSILCRWFGHRAWGYAGGVPYGKIRGSIVDGIGRIHGDVILECDRCGEKYAVASLHINAKAFRDAITLDTEINKGEVL